MPVSLALPRPGGVPFKGVPVGDRGVHVASSVRVSCGGQMGVQRGGLTPPRASREGFPEVGGSS